MSVSRQFGSVWLRPFGFCARIASLNAARRPRPDTAFNRADATRSCRVPDTPLRRHNAGPSTRQARTMQRSRDAGKQLCALASGLGASLPCDRRRDPSFHLPDLRVRSSDRRGFVAAPRETATLNRIVMCGNAREVVGIATLGGLNLTSRDCAKCFCRI
jgi:hypothetical protein